MSALHTHTQTHCTHITFVSRFSGALLPMISASAAGSLSNAGDTLAAATAGAAGTCGVELMRLMSSPPRAWAREKGVAAASTSASSSAMDTWLSLSPASKKCQQIWSWVCQNCFAACLRCRGLHAHV